LGFLRRALERRVHDHGHRHPDGDGQTLLQPVRHARQRGRHERVLGEPAMRTRRVWLTSSLLALGLAGTMLPPRGRAEAQATPGGDSPISDTEFPVASWTVHTAATGGAAETALQNSSGGTSGAWRLMSHTVFSSAAITAWHMYTGGSPASYDPRTGGAIQALDFPLDQILVSGADIGVNGAFAVTQNGRFYVARSAAITSTAWQRV